MMYSCIRTRIGYDTIPVSMQLRRDVDMISGSCTNLVMWQQILFWDQLDKIIHPIYAVKHRPRNLKYCDQSLLRKQMWLPASNYMSNVISECLRSTNNINACLIGKGFSNLRKRSCLYMFSLFLNFFGFLIILFSCNHVLVISAL